MYFDPLKNEPIYIGKGQGNRLRYHLKRLDNSHFANRLRKMKTEGFEPIISKIIENVDASTALRVEMELIEKYGRRDLGTGPLLNMTCGGDGANDVGPETRLKMSEANKGKVLSEETKQRIGNANRGKLVGLKRSDDICEKISMSQKGKKKSEDHVNKINRNPEKIRKTAEKHRGMKRSEETCRKISEKAKGRISKIKGLRTFYHPITLEVVKIIGEQEIPTGFVKGDPLFKNSNGVKGKECWFNPSTRELKLFFKDEVKPDGWERGRPKKVK